MRAYAGEIAAAYEIELSARAAVNAGTVVVPDASGPVHEIYNALGDTVNVAARLPDANALTWATLDEVVVRRSRSA